GQVTNMVAAETTLSAAAGALLGLAISPALHGLATFVPWDGGTWLASDFALPIGLTVFIALAIPVLVVSAGILGLRRVLKNPLFATGGHTRKPLRWWRLLALPGAGLFFLYAVLTAKDSGGIGLVMTVLYVDTDAKHAAQVTGQANAALERYGQSDRALAVGQVYLVEDNGQNRSYERALVMTCADAVKLTRFGFDGLCTGAPGLYSGTSLDVANYKIVGDTEQPGVRLPAGLAVHVARYHDPNLYGPW